MTAIYCQQLILLKIAEKKPKTDERYFSQPFASYIAYPNHRGPESIGIMRWWWWWWRWHTGYGCGRLLFYIFDCIVAWANSSVDIENMIWTRYSARWSCSLSRAAFLCNHSLNSLYHWTNSAMVKCTWTLSRCVRLIFWICTFGTDVNSIAHNVC